MQDAGESNQEAYIRQMALTGYHLRLDTSEVRQMLLIMSNIANNVNQIAKRANETRNIYAGDVKELKNEVANLNTQITDAAAVINKVRKLLELQ